MPTKEDATTDTRQESPAMKATSTARKRAHTAHQPVGCWCRPAKRLAIYLRDGLACCWCGATVEDGATFSLDHVRPVSKGGDNDPSNLLTACKRCNDSRGSRSLAAFARAVAAYLDHGATAREILAHVHACLRRPLPAAEAKALIARRGSVAAALQSGGR